MNQALKNYLASIKNSNIHIVGLASTECSQIALFLHKYQIKNVTIHQNSHSTKLEQEIKRTHFHLTDTELKQIKSLPYKIHFQDSYLQDIDQADIIFVPQSWYLYEANQKLKNHQFILQSITQLYFTLSKASIIGITGTNGKTTTAFATAHILSAHPTKKLYFTGNDRENIQCLLDIENHTPNDLFLLEISNRQLHFPLTRAPHIAAITNITPQHLHEYSSFIEYKHVKQAITKNQTKQDLLIISAEDEHSQSISTKAKVIKIDSQQNSHPISPKDIPLKGVHNLLNLRFAAQIAIECGMDLDTIKKQITTFKGCTKRQEIVAQKNGITYINDTSSTSDISTIIALKSFPNAIFIMGGNPHGGCDLEKVAVHLNTKFLILLESPLAQKLSNLIQKNHPHINFTITQNLNQAMKQARLKATSGDQIVISPCAEYYVYFRKKVADHEFFNHFAKK